MITGRSQIKAGHLFSCISINSLQLGCESGRKNRAGHCEEQQIKGRHISGSWGQYQAQSIVRRNFEYYSEDPYLAGKMAASFIKNAQKPVLEPVLSILPAIIRNIGGLIQIQQ